jgi:hypothetical protein
MGTKRCQGESCHDGLASLCVCVRKTTFMYVCVRLHLCICVWDYIQVCVFNTTFMCVWDYIYVSVFETTFMYVCLRLHSRMFLWTMCNKNLSNNKMTKIKVVYLDELNNFGIHYFFSWNNLGVQIMVWTCYFSNFKFWTDKI